MKWRVAGACATLLMGSAPVRAREPEAKAVYCTQNAKGEWSLQRFKPLISLQGGTEFTEMVFDGEALREVRLRRFSPDAQFVFEYLFDATGKLAALKGKVTVKSVPPAGAVDTGSLVLADWLGQADLLPGADGRIPPHHVTYTRESDRIDKPDDAERYVARFYDAPVYQTVQTVPCAARLQEAERMNATQE